MPGVAGDHGVGLARAAVPDTALQRIFDAFDQVGGEGARQVRPVLEAGIEVGAGTALIGVFVPINISRPDPFLRCDPVAPQETNDLFFRTSALLHVRHSPWLDGLLYSQVVRLDGAGPTTANSFIFLKILPY